jgi:hypothetical protein
MKRDQLLQRLRRKPLKHLRQLSADIQSLIQELEGTPVRRDIDIASQHEGKPELIHSVSRTIGDKTTGHWRQVEMIYCCLERCPQCPHGEFIFQYRRNKRTGTVTVNFGGWPALDSKTLEWLRLGVRDPHPYIVSIGPDVEGNHDSPE